MIVVVYHRVTGAVKSFGESDHAPAFLPAAYGSVGILGVDKSFPVGRRVDVNAVTSGQVIWPPYTEVALPQSYRMVITPVQPSKSLGQNIIYNIEMLDADDKHVPWSGTVVVTIRFGCNPPVVQQHQMTGGQASGKSYTIPNNWPTKDVGGVQAAIPDNVSISATNGDGTIVGEGVTVVVTE